MHKTTVRPPCSIFRNDGQSKSEQSFCAGYPKNKNTNFLEFGIVVSEAKIFESKKTKKGKNSNMGQRIFTRIWPQTDLIMLNTFTYIRIWLKLMVLETYAKICWSNFCVSLFCHVWVIAFFNVFLQFLMLFLSKIFFSDTTWPIETKFGMNVPWGILHWTEVGIFYLLKNMAAVTKNRT